MNREVRSLWGMAMADRRISLQRVLVDLNTQADFLLPDGAFPVSNRDTMLPAIQRLMKFAREERIPIISSLEAHRTCEFQKGLPPHCIDRTRGQQKVSCTLMPRRVLVQGDNTFDLPSDPFRRFQQVIFTKRDPDFLSNPKADRLINAMRPDYWIVCGIAATHSVKALVLGMLARNFRVVVVRDASGYWSANDAEHAFRQMEAKGAIVSSVDSLVSGDIYAQIEKAIAEARKNLETDEITASPRMRQLREERKTRCSSEESKETQKPSIADFVPKHLIRHRARANGKSSGGLA